MNIRYFTTPSILLSTLAFSLTWSLAIRGTAAGSTHSDSLTGSETAYSPGTQHGEMADKRLMNYKMLTLIQEPYYAHFSRNPVCYTLQKPEEFPGYYGHGQRVIYNTPQFYLPVGASLQFSWSGPEGPDVQTFQAVNTPDQPQHIQAGDPGGTFSQYLQLIAEKMITHPKLSPWFSASVELLGQGSWRIIFETKQVEEGWGLQIVPSLNILVGGVTISYEDYQPSLLPDNHRVYLEVFFEDVYKSGNYERVAQLNDIVDASGNVCFDLQDILESSIKASFQTPPIPPYDNDQAYRADNLRRYFIRYTETLGDPPTVSRWIYHSTKLLMCGGISQSRWSDCTDFFENINNLNSLLTWLPDGRKVTPDQPHYIHWIKPDDEEGYDLQILLKGYGENGLIFEDEIPLSLSSYPEWYEVTSIPVGYSQLNMSSYESLYGEKILKYTVQVFDASFPAQKKVLSQERTYYVDCTYYECRREILYLNGFCLPEIIYLTGDTKKDLRVSRSVSAKVIDCSYKSINGEYFQYDQDFDNIYTYRSGFIRKVEAEALQELLIYNAAYEVFSSGYVPLLITDDKFSITECRQFLHEISFAAVRGLKQRSYSNAVIECSDTIPACPDGSWVTPDDECWELPNNQKWGIIAVS
jgi:hypothetical protein